MFGAFLIGAAPVFAEGSIRKVDFGTKSGRLWLERSQVIPVTVAEAPGRRVTLPTTVEPAGAAEILQPATILKGEKTGFVRLRARQEGRLTLRVGSSVLRLDVAADSSAGAWGDPPVLISPPDGAWVYGTITAGIEVNHIGRPGRYSIPRLLLPDGRELAPRAQTLPATSTAQVFAYDINMDDLPAGPLVLTPCAYDAAGKRVVGAPVQVNVFRPGEAAMVAGPCAERVNDPRPERWGAKIPKVENRDGDTEVVVNKSPDPSWCLHEIIDEPGWYQLTLRVRGDAGAGSFPSIGLMLNENDRAAVGTRLVDTGWHRLPVGRPVRLEAGGQFLTARFLNDFSRGTTDRNLYLDRYELVRVAGDTPAAPEGPAMKDGAAAMMMSETAMTSAPTMAGGEATMAEGVPMMADETAMLPRGGRSPGVSFLQPIHGRLVQGALQLRAKAWLDAKQGAPLVELMVNGKKIATQRGREPVFTVPAAALRKGGNSLQLRLRVPGALPVESPTEVAILAEAPAKQPAPRVARFGVEDPAWDPGVAQKLEKSRPVATFYSNGDAVLTLPPELAGEFDVRMDANGREFRGPPLIEALLRTGDTAPVKFGEAGVSGDRVWNLGRVRLEPGAKQLILRFGNDLAAKEGDRNWWLRAVTLEEASAPDLSKPRVTVRYPRSPSLAVRDAGAVVAEVFAPGGIAWTDLVIDGKPQNLRLTQESGLGRAVLPIAAGTLKPGAHRLQVLARGNNGVETLSSPLRLTVVSTAGQEDPAYARAVHLLSRFAYGPEPEELADVLVRGEKAWLRDRLTATMESPGEQAALQRAWNEQPDPTDKGQVVPRVLKYLVLSPNPVRTRFVLWTENHFSTWITKCDALNKWTEHRRFLDLGAAPFGDLLMASATSPAMLTYLDQNRSFGRSINENYAREIMELHTVGVDAGYRQEDVTALASVLTGLTLSADAPVHGSLQELPRTFRYEPILNSPGEQQVFGMFFPKVADPSVRLDRTLAAIEMLAAHPRTAGTISRKLAEHYVSVPAPERLVARLSRKFRSTGGDMKEMLLTLADSPEFWSSMNSPRIATPLDFSLRLARVTDSGNTGAMRDFLRKSGMGLFDRATPDGYPEADANYANSNALLQRWQFAIGISGNLRRLVPATILPAAKDPWDDLSRRNALDIAALRLTGRPLEGRTREAAIRYLSQIPPEEKDRARIVASLVAQLPQANLR